MLVLRALGTFIFFFICFLLMWTCVNTKMKDWRSSFVTAALYFGLFVWLLTEGLSLFSILTPLAILCGWIIYIGIMLAILGFLNKKSKIQIMKPQIFPFQWEYAFLILILFITFFIAIAYPPNNWDSMTYHLPRVEHWLQNKNINHYYTSIARQVISAPFPAILILQSRALSGFDYLVNLVQWFAFLGTVIGISKISWHLGLNRKAQIASALFFATAPMAILQASSTQTDLVESFFIICMVERLLAWRKTGTIFESISFGIALGLAILTKGTAYSIAFPFVLYFAIISIKHFRKRLVWAFLASILCMAINFPHYTRNYIGFRNPVGAHWGTVSNFTVKSFVITSISNINSNLAFPRAEGMNVFLDKMWDTFGVDNTIFPFGRPKIDRLRSLMVFSEDIVKNFFHTILLILAFVVLFICKKPKTYGFLVIASLCMFAYFIPWQPWITRLQLPLFALSAPVFAMAFEGKNKFRKLSILALACYAILPLFLNFSRMAIPPPKIDINNNYRTIWTMLNIPDNLQVRAAQSQTIWNTPRDELIFRNRHSYSNYTEACASVVQSGIQNLGLIIDGDSWEYPLWRYMRKNGDKKVRITHVREDSLDNIDGLFVLQRMVSMIDAGEDKLNMNNPVVLIRDSNNVQEWKILYGTKLD